MGVIRGEIGRKRGHMALRQLFEKAGTAVQRIKPVLLMSPISVAQFLPPGTISFDLLVIDEASQVRPEDALGAIARAKQIVVVGDTKQLPPSSFFDRLMADDEDDNEGDDENTGPDLLEGAAKIGDMESILTLCEARGLPGRMLKWHYRSRDPSLIEVSNHEFYEDELVLPPSPLQKDPAYGLRFTRVDGVYDKGGKRDNRREGEAIVNWVAEHARQNPTQSLGIVTFSFAQRNLITLLLEERRRRDAVLDGFLREGQVEDVFVKNIENVQGDERDVILVSVGYRRAEFKIRSPYEPHEAPISVLADLVAKIVDAEGPIHVEEIARRVASAFGREKAGSRILAATERALGRAQTVNRELRTEAWFWFTSAQADASPVRDRSAEVGATLKAASISLLEIKAAFNIARDDNAGGDNADLARTVARLMGFKRVGPDLQARIAAGLTI